MKCFVTGATGFIGSNLVAELVVRGHTVRALIRPGANQLALTGLEFEPVVGDVTDRAVLAHALKGCDWCFHVAANYQLWMRDYRPMYRTNVDGTRAVLEAAAEAGCRAVVYTSTVGCIGLPRPNRGSVAPADETTPPTPAQLSNHYKRSKWLAEQIALDLARRGAPVVIVNPTAPIGPRDVKPTPTGQIILDFLHRRMPAYLNTGLNWVHVRDVAVGHILAAEKGQPGQRYILGNAEGNWTLEQTFNVLAELTGLPAPRRRIPYAVAYVYALFGELVARLTGRPPRAPLAGVKMARYKMFFNPRKAITELGLPQTPPRQAFIEAIEWFRAHGYAPTR